MAHRISTDELAERLVDILEIVHRQGERFVVERDGKPLVTLSPAHGDPDVSWSEFIARLADLPRPDDTFADDLEEIQATMNRQRVELPEWLS
ncbi:MAG: hypothetical protein ACRDJW_03530 [Thermomicrobiales bacterium]